MFVSGLFIGFGTRLAGGCERPWDFRIVELRMAKSRGDDQLHDGRHCHTQLLYRVFFI
jgi:hypothetical protein